MTFNLCWCTREKASLFKLCLIDNWIEAFSKRLINCSFHQLIRVPVLKRIWPFCMVSSSRKVLTVSVIFRFAWISLKSSTTLVYANNAPNSFFHSMHFTLICIQARKVECLNYDWVVTTCDHPISSTWVVTHSFRCCGLSCSLDSWFFLLWHRIFIAKTLSRALTYEA